MEISRVAWVVFLLAAAPLGSARQAEDDHVSRAEAGTQLFRAEVRQILVENCLYCHGGGKVKGDFDLSRREGILKDGPDGPRVLPGDPGGSRLLGLVRHEHPPHMPDKAEKLADERIAAIEEWIRLGAPYDRPLVDDDQADGPMAITEQDRQWWAYRPLARPEPPLVAVEHGRPIVNEIDRFWRAKLREARVRPVGRADERTLRRRRYLNLWGLPPDSVEHSVDQMLAHEHFGEHWGRHWLDIVRFAESHGYEHDYDRPNAWHYRDFVIRSFAQDRPFDEFVRWQIAGDELAPEDPDAWRATGFLAAGTHSTQITKNQVEKERYDELADMVGVLGTSMLATTIGCARCHDHKFDPVPSRDFYRLCATFTKAVRSDHELTLETDEWRAALTAHEAEHSALLAGRQAFEEGELPARFEAWLEAPRLEDRDAWKLVPIDGASEGGATFELLSDGSLRVGGAKADHDVHTLVGVTSGPVAALRLEALADDGLVKRGPGRGDNGNFGLSDVQLFVEPLDGSGPAQEIELVAARATFDQAGLPVANAIDDSLTSCWAVDPRFGEDHAAVFELAEVCERDGGMQLTLVLTYRNNVRHQIGRPRLSVTGTVGGLALAMASEPAAMDQLRAGEELIDAERASLLAWFRQTDEEWRSLDLQVSEHAANRPEAERIKMLVSSEGLPAVRLHTQGGDFLEHTHLLTRGDPNLKGEVMTPGFLRVLSREGENRWLRPAPGDARTPHHRANLAAWLTDVDAGAGALLARVIANRVWQHHFGRGIVRTPDEFGLQGESPTHPALLEWLACELVESGWSLHHLHRRILESECWRQSSEWSNEAAAIDPENRLLWRFAPRRLDAESLRDSMLAVTGALDRTPFGKGTLDPMQKRRSVYFTVKRSRIVPMMRAFDGPDALGALPVRVTTTVAPQALFLMNDPAVREWAEYLAAELVSESTDSGQVVSRAWQRILGRGPEEVEALQAVEFLTKQAATHGEEPSAAADLCQALLATNEFAYVE